MMTQFRRFLLLFSSFLYIQVSFAETQVPETRQSKPNIVFILADDQRNDTLGCAGHPVIKTPTIDRLAEKGIRFENAFVTTPICAASRASIFTGLYERHHGFTFGKPPVAEEFANTSYPALLKEAGYRTAYIGKWHAQFENPEATFSKMFDWYQPVSSKAYIVKDKEGRFRHETELCGDLAIEFLESQTAEKPFALSIGFFAAHAVDSDHRPGHHYEPLYETVKQYKEGAVQDPRFVSDAEIADIPDFLRESISRERWHWRWDDPDKYDANMRDYYRLISGIDLTVARVLKVLKQKGLEENTIIVYAADNGYLMGDRKMAGKWNHYEQSLRVPLIVYDPRLTNEQQGRLCSKMALNIDIAPTLLEYGGISIPEHYDGVSLKSIIEGREAKNWRTSFYCEHGMIRSNIPRWSGVRTEGFKYAIYTDYKDQGGEFLHDLDEDPDELVNLAQRPEFEEKLLFMRRLHQHFQDQIPYARESGEK